MDFNSVERWPDTIEMPDILSFIPATVGAGTGACLIIIDNKADKA